MSVFKKQFAFDLIADKNSPILQYYNSISGAYDAIEKYMKSHEFIHRQNGLIKIQKNIIINLMKKIIQIYHLMICADKQKMMPKK